MKKNKFKSALIIGMGLIGSSISRAFKEKNISDKIYGLDSNIDVINKCDELSLLTQGETNINNFNKQFDLVIICTPISTYKNVFRDLNDYILEPTLITDVGSTKVSVIEDYKKIINNKNIKFLPAHPIAGLEKSGPEHGFSKLFENRYCIVTPIDNDSVTYDSVTNMWSSLGMQVEKMIPTKHDKVLAMTSHIPQLIAYSVVATATELETHLKNEVIKNWAQQMLSLERVHLIV